MFCSTSKTECWGVDRLSIKMHGAFFGDKRKKAANVKMYLIPAPKQGEKHHDMQRPIALDVLGAPEEG